jgi:hypothetical protein
MSVRAALPRYFTDSNLIVTGSWYAGPVTAKVTLLTPAAH